MDRTIIKGSGRLRLKLKFDFDSRWLAKALGTIAACIAKPDNIDVSGSVTFVRAIR